MKFKAKTLCYIEGKLVQEGEKFSYPDEKLARDEAGNVDLSKYPSWEPLSKSAPVVDADEDLSDADDSDDTDDDDNAVKPANQDELNQMIKEAVSGLDASVDEHWTAKGLPDVSAVSGILGYDVTRKEIDAAAKGITRPTE